MHCHAGHHHGVDGILGMDGLPFTALWFLSVLLEGRGFQTPYIILPLSSKLPDSPHPASDYGRHYQKQFARGKTKPQALILISQRLINIIYGMFKNNTEYVMPNVQENRD